MSRLRGRIDAAFLPRPLRVVDTLPRNELGKLPRAEILRLISSPPEPAADRTHTADPAASSPVPILLRFPADHPAGPGHFPGNPIIPGAVLLDELVAAIFPGDWTGVVEVGKIPPSGPAGDTVAVTHRTDGDTTRFECRLAGIGQLVLSGVLRAPFPSR